MTISKPDLMNSSLAVWPSIPGYKILAQLHANDRTVVYRAVALEGSSEAISANQSTPLLSKERTVIIKLLCKTTISFGEISRFRNQAAITQFLKHPGISQIYHLGEYQQQPMIVMEDFGGISLDLYIKNLYINRLATSKEPLLDTKEGTALNTQVNTLREANSDDNRSSEKPQLELLQFLSIAVQIADILAAIHRKNIIHKDIKPHNILIHPPSGRIQLIDFSLSSLLPREQQGIHPPEALEGSLAYLAPEQTGRMNRGVDYRSDFYALGVTFYELLGGQLPFQEQEALALIHCHIAKQPSPLRQLNKAVPETVGAIVAKLMAKNPEDRYQSATGLKHDLEACLHDLKDNGTVSSFPLGRHNPNPPFILSEKLYGRQHEVQTLMDGFEAAATGATKMILIGGFSGIGKTAVVNEVHKPILEKRGYFISGKFDQLNRTRPFSAVIAAFEHLIEQLLESGAEAVEQWKDKILTALNGQGQVIADLLPELTQLIGPQSAIAPLSGTAAQNRFNQVFQQFIQVFSQPEHPLVLFLDDLQWADLASLQLLEALATQSDGHLLLLGAYRDNEVFPAHPFNKMVETLTALGCAPEQIILYPLATETLNQLTADTLRCPPKDALALTQLIYNKAKGNPFFTTQYLKSLQKEGLITFQPEAQCWQYDLETISQETLTDDVVALMLQQLRQLPESAQKALKLAACIGNVFDLNTLSIVCDRTPHQTAAALWEALQSGMILPVNEAYKFYQQPATATFSAAPLSNSSTEIAEGLASEGSASEGLTSDNLA
ncbi:MAG: AAA family ATPase, partial [Cyanobacteria bacterium J06632_3]